MSDEITVKEISEEKYTPRKWWLAALLNLIIPGLGIFYCGEFTLGILFAALYPLMKTLTFFASIYLTQHYRGGAVDSFYLYSFLILLIYPIVLVKKKKEYTIKENNSGTIYASFILLYIVYKIIIFDFNFDLYSVDNECMTKTLENKDEVVVQMSRYGFYLPFFNKKIVNWSSPKNNDVVLFFPDENWNKSPEKFLCSRVVGTPGDTIMIRDKTLDVNGILEPAKIKNKFDDIIRDTAWKTSVIYPANIKWGFNYYGPMQVPGKDFIIKIDSSNISLWKPLIFAENPPDKLDPDNSNAENKYIEGLARTVLKDGQYRVRKNYYFLLPDNRTELVGNRVNGLICEDDIVGKLHYILSNFDDKQNIDEKRGGMKIE